MWHDVDANGIQEVAEEGLGGVAVKLLKGGLVVANTQTDVLGKYLFGGLGYNAFNPALVGRAFLQAAFPVSMTTWYPAFGSERFSSSILSLVPGARSPDKILARNRS